MKRPKKKQIKKAKKKPMRKKPILKGIYYVINILSMISVFVIGVATYHLYSEELKVSKIENKPAFTLFYDSNNKEILIQKSNGSISNINVEMSCEYRASIVRYSDTSEVIYGDVPFSLCVKQIIDVENKGEETFFINLNNIIKEDKDIGDTIVEKFKNTNYNCQLNLSYIIDITYYDDFEDEALEHQYYILRTDDYSYMKEMTLDYGNTNILTNRIIKLNENDNSIFANNKTNFDWLNKGVCSVEADTIINKIGEIHDILSSKKLED